MTAQHGDESAPAREDALVARLQSLGTLLAEHPDDRHRAATRARLVAMAAVRTPAAGAVRSPVAPRLRRLVAAGRRSRLTAGLAGAALTVGALGGVLAASQGAAPGDLLYEVKRGGERTQLALAGDATRGPTLLDFASTRLTELTELARAADTGLVVDTLGTMDGQTTRGAAEVTSRSVEAADPTALSALATWAAGQESGLRALTGAVPEPAGPALAGSTDLVAAVAERATALVAALACTAGPPAAGADELGPLPAPCPSAPSRTATRGGTGGDASVAAAPGQGAAAPATGAADADTAEPGPAPVPGGTAPSPVPGTGASASGVPSAGAPSAAPGEAPAPAGRTPSAAGGAPGRGGLELPRPSPPRGTPTPAGPSTPPVVDLPLPVCVSALGLPVLC